MELKGLNKSFQKSHRFAPYYQLEICTYSNYKDFNHHDLGPIQINSYISTI